MQVAFSAAQTKAGAAPVGPAGEASAERALPADAAVVNVPAEPPRATRSMPAAVLPWLGAVTLAVLYLLAKTFL